MTLARRGLDLSACSRALVFAPLLARIVRGGRDKFSYGRSAFRLLGAVAQEGADDVYYCLIVVVVGVNDDPSSIEPVKHSNNGSSLRWQLNLREDCFHLLLLVSGRATSLEHSFSFL